MILKIILYNGLFSDTRDPLIIEAEKYFKQRNYEVVKINLFNKNKKLCSKYFINTIKEIERSYPNAIHIGHSMAGFFLGKARQKINIKTILWDPTDFYKRKNNPRRFFLYNKLKNKYLIRNTRIEIDPIFFWELAYKKHKKLQKTNQIFILTTEKNNSYYKNIISVRINSDHNFTNHRNELFSKTIRIIEEIECVNK